jgi:predicted nucleic acid-binding protein
MATGRGLLDTNILIHWQRLERTDLPQQAAVSAITLAELAAGVHAVTTDDLERSKRVDLLQRVESTFDPIPFESAAARAYGRVVAAVRARGRSPRSRVADLMIAAIAAAQNLPLYTTNPADFDGLDGVVEVVTVTRPT